MFRRSTPAYRLRDGENRPGSVASLDEVRIGGTMQWILTRGVDEQQPILLFLHGGPGGAQIAVARRYQRELERAFVVANWDQRGAGLSYTKGIPRETMTIDQLVEDTLEVTRWLLQRFDRPRLTLLGHSWGTILGLLAANRAPELFDAYIGAAQVVEPQESERRLLEWSREEAKRRHLSKATRALGAVTGPPYRTLGEFSTVRHWADEFGARARRGTDRRLVLDAMFHSSEYTFGDLVRYGKGERFSVSCLIEAAGAIDMSSRVTRLRIPTYFISGRSDRIVDPSLAREYLRVLEAPKKGWAWIEDAAHLAPFEEPDAFAAAVAAFSRQDPVASPPSWSVAG
ncbi:MAG: alpha/beta hydrolase [Thermoplasmata archaeon]|nr:alpha/beta hydrolase [Thermoplasmata archaeon]